MSNTTATQINTTPEAKALAMAQKIIAANKLGWIKGTGYRLPMTKICQDTGLNYSRAYMAIMVPLLPASEAIKVEGVTEANLATQIRKARLEEGQSWGYIMVRTGGLTAGRVQKLFKQSSGYEAAGLRIGRGGRFVNDQPSLYQGSDRKDLGCEIPQGQRKAAKPTVARKLEAVTNRQATQGLKAKPTKAAVRKAKRQAPKPVAAEA